MGKRNQRRSDREAQDQFYDLARWLLQDTDRDKKSDQHKLIVVQEL